MGLAPAGRSAVAAPFPFGRMRRRFGAHGGQDDVAADFQQIALLVYQDRLEAPLKHMSHAPVSSIISLSVDAVELAHADGEVAVGGLDDEVVVVAHEAIGVAEPVIAV